MRTILPRVCRFLQLGEGRRHLIQRVTGRDRELDLARGHQLGHLGQDLWHRGLGAALGLGAEFASRFEGDDGVDPLARHAEFDGQPQVLRTEQIDEGADAVTPSPISVTTPARSLLSPDGNEPGYCDSR
jgi:hypothetical protein